MKLLRLMALVAFLPFAAHAAAPMETVQPVDGNGVPLGTPSNPLYVSGGGGGGGGGATGSVTPAGTNGAAAQAVQGITGGVPLNGWVGQYNATLPTFSNAQVGYVAVDSNGRQILSPSSSVSVSNFPATQAVSGTVNATQGTSPWVVSNGGTFAVQNTAPVVGGNSTAVKTDSSATTQPISATALPLPTGASTAANQATEIAALQAIQQRAVAFSEATAASVAASGTSTGASRDAGAAPLYTKFNAVVSSTQNGTLSLQGSNDNFTTSIGVASVTTTANVPAYITVPVLFRYSRFTFTNGSTTTAATVSVNTSYTAN